MSNGNWRPFSPEEPAYRWHARQVAFDQLAEQYPGQAVAYREVWNGTEMRPDVLGAAPSLIDLHQAMEHLTEVDWAGVRVELIPDPDTISLPLCVLMELDQRIDAAEAG